MPVEKRIPGQSPETQQLVEDLRREYELGGQSPNSEPRIILDEDSARGPLHVYVVWSKWGTLPQPTRSEIIMDAMEKAMKPDDLVRITLAWGLTQEEWKRLAGSGVPG